MIQFIIEKSARKSQSAKAYAFSYNKRIKIMFDYHIHSSVSFDSESSAESIAKRAKEIGLSEICFTDHCDYNSDKTKKHYPIDLREYDAAYNGLRVPGLKIKRGFEFGMTDWNTPELDAMLSERQFDFVIGSVHFVDGFDPYDREYWIDKTEREAYLGYLERILECVKIHDRFNVLGHLTYVSRSVYNPTKNLLEYRDYRDVCDEIFKVLIKKDKGIEINTSAIGSLGVLLPSYEFVNRFRELGGRIITVGSDAHSPERVGQHIDMALALAKEVFGYVCTFDNLEPKFNML